MPLQPVEAYQVGVLCALPKEMTAARAMLDEEHEPLKVQDAQDSNSYVLGRVHEHNVVIACLPAGIYGTNAAATVANNMLRTFPGFRFGLMVGIGGGIPNLMKGTDIRLGDVVVSQPDQTHGGVVQYDLGKNLGQGRFERKGSLDKPPTVLLTAISFIQSQPGPSRRRVSEYVSAMIRKPDLADEDYVFPGTDQDQLFCTRCDRSQWRIWWWMIWMLLFWLNPLWLCNVCDKGKILRSLKREGLRIHYGTIASGNWLVKNAAERDRLGDKFDAKCVEMEAAGLMNNFPCIVIRGICDYADSHKNDVWQKYAAVTAAAFAKELLSIVSPKAVDATKHATNVMNHRMDEFLSEHIQLREQDIERRCHQAFRTRPYEQYKDYNHDRVAGTCRWVLDHSQFRSWQLSDHNDLLWISADPGCGKSVLSKALVDHEFSDTDQCVCYFFFKDNEQQDELAPALCAVLHQLFSDQPHLLHHATRLWKENGNKIPYVVDKMWQLLLDTTSDKNARSVICILDALDECRDDDRRELITRLCKFYQRSSQVQSTTTTLKFLVTSRPYDNVQRWFEQPTLDLPCIRLRGEDENDRIHAEINLVVDRRICDLAAEFRLSENHQTRLRHRLRQMNHRTYLWLYLSIEEIRTTYRDSLDPEGEQIDTLPTSVENAYERLLQRVTDKQKPQARKILLIIVGARAPLTVSEMSLALNAARAHEQAQSFVQEPNVQQLEKQVREWCGLFVFVNHSRLFLIHQTAKEFLLAESSAASLEPSMWKSSMSMPEIEAEMASLCITYLYLSQRRDDQNVSINSQVRPSIQIHDRADEDGFFRYCAEHWTSHLADDVVAKDSELLNRVLSLYDTYGLYRCPWFPIMWRNIQPGEETPHMSSQHMIAMSGHAFVLHQLYYNTGFELEKKDSTGRTALHWAAERGHSAVVSWLVKTGAKVNAQRERDSDALYAASESEHEIEMRLLLDVGSQFDTGRSEYSNVLQAASAGGDEKVVQTLLDAGAYVDARELGGNTALYTASKRGHEKVVRMLLDARADVNTTGSDGTALYVASVEGREKIVRILLDAGADPNTEGTALYAASVLGYEQIVQMLLDAGVDANAKGRTYATALQGASGEICEEPVQILPGVGADVNTEGEGHGKALYTASVESREKIVQMLLNVGADVNAEAGHYGTALQRASGEGHEKIVQMLLDVGADVNAEAGPYGTALQRASGNGHEKIVQILLDAGADVNTGGGFYGTALQRASGNGHEKVVQMLLDAGADVNAEGAFYGTALQAASAKGHWRVAQMLRDAMQST